MHPFSWNILPAWLICLLNNKPKWTSFVLSTFYRWIFLHFFSLPSNWSYGWSRFSTAVHPQPPPPYQPPQYSMHQTMTSTYGLKQPPQTIHLLQNNTREVCYKKKKKLFVGASHLTFWTELLLMYPLLNRACHQDLLRVCHLLTVNLHPITQCWLVKIDFRDHHPTVHL